MNRKILTLFTILLLALTSCGHDPITKDVARVIHADVVALDHNIYFNRFGSHDPYGMIFALKSDVQSKDSTQELRAGKVTLRSDKRPRPLVLRANVGDILEVTFTNLLNPKRPERDEKDVAPVEEEAARIAEKDRNLSNNPCAPLSETNPAKGSPTTRCASIAISGLPTVDPATPENSGTRSIPPNTTITYRWRAERTGTFQFASLAAPSGGEGDGGSLVHGLFGAVNVEPKDSHWYRSAVKESDLKLAKEQARAPALYNYEAAYKDGKPVLNLLQKVNGNTFNLLYSPLDTIIVEPDKKQAHREFTVIFHDELKTVFQKQFSILSPEQFAKDATTDEEKKKKLLYSKQLAGVRDGFGINYGASGMGTVLLANRQKIGPAKDCVDCFYEEFFLQSWANGDPALLAEYDDDPSNVHHSYLNDPVQFQNSHAGPKETHVFHLHAHQWLSSASEHPNYLDSQTIAPQQGFSYQIKYDLEKGRSGNKNQTPGDSIFHCHLYPHFAQGMWELWRTHDVFEDGSRRLPDGGDNGVVIDGRDPKKTIMAAKGTDPLTGATQGGTPIPAIVPLPFHAMPPGPKYGENGFPGYPFYIAGEAGHRTPQPPLDIVDDGGLGRHIVAKGKRTFPGGATAEEQVKNADLTVKIESAQIKLIPNDGTALEKAAMRFHANAAGHSSITPEGKPDTFKVNGKAPQPGAPFADPCGKEDSDLDKSFNTRRYKVSAIDLGIQTNEEQWHDPQSRINVLDEEVPHYENGRFVKDAEPFFFRAESGECVEFVHTNRTHKDLYRDDFQVATPTDIIGQHIHLVKFDVTSSDGSGNGFNYQDGTMAKEAIAELAKASKAVDGAVIGLDGKLGATIKPEGYQKTIQRWWVDQFFHEDGYDAGLGTVFTHDHFAPSSIQHHGFYNALLVEPKGSDWLTPSGVDLKGKDKNCQPINIKGLDGAYNPANCKESSAVGARAQILTDRKDLKRHPDTREFALAIADFALLYDKRVEDAPIPMHMEHLANAYHGIRNKEGSPVDPPERPEAISVDHHNPYLINYKHEPIPLRIGERDSNKHFQLRDKALCDNSHTSNIAPDTLCHPDDIAYAFSSKNPHGDPFLKPLRAYEGDKVQIRLIQGAQEVQHTFNVHGLSWKREANNPTAPHVNAQEIGISEHFELSALNISNIARGLKTADYLFHAGSQDALWNGAWGLVRGFASPESKDPTTCETTSGELSKDGLETCKRVGNEADWKAASCLPQDDRLDGCLLKPLPDNHDGMVKAKNVEDVDGNTFAAKDLVNGKYCETRTKTFQVEAWQVKDLRAGELYYDQQANVYDPDALVYIEKSKVDGYKKGVIIEPLVLRAKANECIAVELTSHIGEISDQKGDALMPKIVSFNVDARNEITGEAKPSNRIGLHAQRVNYNILTNDGSMVGFNAVPTSTSGYALDGETKRYLWFPWDLEVVAAQTDQEKYVLKPFDEPVVAALTPADPIGQVTHGLFGALVVYPKNAEIQLDANSQLSANVKYTDRNGKSHNYREHVVFYQDGLNLHQRNVAIPDCFICDDSYDFGEKGINYHSAAFWQRLGLKTDGNKGFDLNDVAFPANFYEESYKPLPFNDFKAKAGEELRFLVLHPGGRARQHSFQLYGHTFSAGIKDYGSPWSMLIASGKAEMLVIDNAKPGTWLYRDGPANMFSSGVWGRLLVE